MVITDGSPVIEPQRDRPPDAAGHHAYAPVPAVAVRGFPCKDAQPFVRVVVVRRIVEPVGRPLRQRLLDGRPEEDMQPVLPLAKHLFHRNGVAHKHIVCLQQQRTVQVDARISIQPLESHQGGVARKLFLRHRKGGLVFPVLIFHPLDFLFIHAEERIGQQPVAQQVLMHRPRHGGRQPLVRTRLREHPSPVQHPCFRSIVGMHIRQASANYIKEKEFTF